MRASLSLFGSINSRAALKDAPVVKFKEASPKHLGQLEALILIGKFPSVGSKIVETIIIPEAQHSVNRQITHHGPFTIGGPAQESFASIYRLGAETGGTDTYLQLSLSLAIEPSQTYTQLSADEYQAEVQQRHNRFETFTSASCHTSSSGRYIGFGF